MTKKPRILVVDDEAAVRVSLRDWLMEDGYEVGLAESGDAAIVEVQEKEWDVPEGASVGFVFEKLKLPKEIRITVLVNNKSVDQKTVLKDGDVVHILPQMAGG